VSGLLLELTLLTAIAHQDETDTSPSAATESRSVNNLLEALLQTHVPRVQHNMGVIVPTQPTPYLAPIAARGGHVGPIGHES
jgi:hypothetical protein